MSAGVEREEAGHGKCDGFGNRRTETRSETRKEALERLVKEDPGKAWMLTLEEEGQLTLNQQEEAHDEWSYDNSGLTQEAALAISIAASAATGGVGGAVMGAGLSSLAASGAVNAINALGRGDGLDSAIRKTLSEENLKGAAISMATAGFGEYAETAKWSNYAGGDMGTRMLMGGTAASLTTGDHSSFWRGAAAGVIPADMWTGDVYMDNALGNALVTGAREYTRGYIVNGKEGAEFYLKGAVLNNVIGHGANYVGSGFDTPEFKDGVWVYNTGKDGYGLSIGNANGVGLKDGKYNPKTLKHERQHSQFQDPLGPWYLPIHIINQGIHFGSDGEVDGAECPPWMPEDNGGYKCQK